MLMEQHWIFLLLGLAPHEQEGVSKFRNEIWFSVSYNNGLLVRSRNSPPRRVKLSSLVCVGHSISYVIGCFFSCEKRMCSGFAVGVFCDRISSGKSGPAILGILCKDIMVVDPQKNPLQMTIHSNFWIAISEVMWIDRNDSCAVQSILVVVVELKGLPTEQVSYQVR